jgi:hypothetical protein
MGNFIIQVHFNFVGTLKIMNILFSDSSEIPRSSLVGSCLLMVWNYRTVKIHCAVAVPELRAIIDQGSVVLRQFLNLRPILIQEYLLLRFFWRPEIPSPLIFRRSGISSYKDTPCAQGCLISQNACFHVPLFPSLQSVQKELSWRLDTGVVSGWLFSNTGEGVNAGLSYAPYSNVGSSFG